MTNQSKKTYTLCFISFLLLLNIAPIGQSINLKNLFITGENIAPINKIIRDSEFSDSYSVQKTIDGGYIAAGEFIDYDEEVIYASLVKFDNSGCQDWFKLFEGSGFAGCSSVKQTSDNGYILTGFSQESGGPSKVLLLKTDENGNKEWEKNHLIADSSIGYSIQQTSDGGYIISGASVLDAIMYSFILKTNSLGEFEQCKTFFNNEFSAGRSVEQIGYNYYVVGFTTLFGPPPDYECIEKGYIIKFDSDLNMIWGKNFSGIDNCKLSSFQPTSDNGFIMVGGTYALTEESEEAYGMLIKADSEGNEEWQKTFEVNKNAIFLSVQQTDDEGFVISGQCGNFNEYQADALILKTDLDGNEEWNSTFEFDNYLSVSCSLDKTDNGFIMSGFYYTFGMLESRGVLIKADSEGNEEWITIFNFDENNPPNSPILGGISEGYTRKEYEFSIESNDSEGDEIYYLINWDDESSNEWIGPFESGEKVCVNQTWNKEGEYEIKAKARDITGEESDWSEVKTISIKDFDENNVKIIIKTISSGQIFATIRNKGEESLSDIYWNLSATGRLFGLNKRINVSSEGNVEIIEPGEKTQIYTSKDSIKRKIGIIVIKANAEINGKLISKEQLGFVFGKIVITRLF